MEVVGLVFASAAAIDQVLTRGSQLAQRIEQYKKLRHLVPDVRFLVVESSQSKLREQLLLGQSICVNTANKDLKNHLNKTFEETQMTIYTVSDLLDELDKGPSFFTFKGRLRAIEAAVKRLKTLKSEFFDHVLLAQAKQTLPAARLLSTDDFRVIETIELLTPSVQLGRCDLTRPCGRVAPAIGTFLIDKSYTNGRRDVEKLAEILGSATASPGILDFVGFRLDPTPNPQSPYELIFAVPDGTTINASLQRALQGSELSPLSLNNRISLCAQLASAVLHVHSQLGMVHKNINSGNIISAKVSKGVGHLSAIESALFLTDWRYARNENAATDMSGASNWASRLYQHPSRQLPRAESKYTMGHDIYSLGVCMLEVLLWKPMVIITADGKPEPSPLLRDMLKLTGLEFEAGEVDLADDEDDVGTPTEQDLFEQHLSDLDPAQVQAMLIKTAEKKLPITVGELMSGVVLNCLGCLEENEAPVSFQGGDSVEIGMNFIALIKSSIDAVVV